MTAPTAFRGLLAGYHIGLLPAQTSLTVLVDKPQLGQVLARIGTPAPAELDHAPFMPSLAILPCPEPTHPQRDEEVLAIALADALTLMLQAGAAPLKPAVALSLAQLREAIADLSLFTDRPSAEGADAR